MNRGSAVSERPLTLPALLMRRAALVAGVVLLLACVLGLARLGADVDDEVQAAGRLARLMAVLGSAQAQGDERLLAQLREIEGAGLLRHLNLQLRDADGRLLFASATARPPAWLGWALPAAEADGTQTATWLLPRPAGGAWQVRLATSPADEQREALADLALTMGLLLLAAAGLLASMRLNLRLALRPLGVLLQAIAGIGRDDRAPLRGLPGMPVIELASVATALRQLDAALQSARDESRQLGQRLLRSQDEERARVAHELHDELGQRLTAMRVETAHLLRSLDADAPTRTLALGLQSHCEQLQRELRSLLAGLQPLGPGLAPDEPVEPAELRRLLDALAADWNQRAAIGEGARIELRWRETGDTTQPLPRSLALLLYRITQEALTNIARHARARQVTVEIDIDRAAARAHWCTADDGIGLADARQAMRQGNGLAGINQRVFAAGGDLRLAAADPGAAHPGLRLSASLPLGPLALT